MSNKSLWCLCCFLGLSTAFAEMPLPTPTDKAIIIDTQQSTATIVMAANPTTGYSWYLKTYDASLIEPVSAVFTPPEKMLPGKGGMMTWTFKKAANAPSVPVTTTLTFVYARSWETATPSDKEQRFTLYFR